MRSLKNARSQDRRVIRYLLQRKQRRRQISLGIRYWYVLPMYWAVRVCRLPVSDEDVEEYIGIINQIAQEHPILVDKYLMGKEIEVDAVCDGDGHSDPWNHGAYRACRYPLR